MKRRGFVSLVCATLVPGCGAEQDENEEMPRQSPTPGRPTTERGTPQDRATGTATATPIHSEYETTEVFVRSPAGDLRGSVTAAVADTPELRYRGLSDTESLPPDRGMLFVFDTAGDQTFVMRDMDFGIDVTFTCDPRSMTL
ncbi:MAG: hypothetical protein BRD41_00820 [Bacteroidetes bacterium QS_1_63_11]|nr:MAG: hypothetical protein BRD41_00820 [Bacteroidetes bacterium QS_1_63_11]